VAVQVVGKDKRQVLWTYEAIKGRFSTKRATASAAADIVKALLKAGQPKKTKPK
jgi:hypothetical protein